VLNEKYKYSELTGSLLMVLFLFSFSLQVNGQAILKIAITHVSIIDVEKGKVLPDQTIFIEGDRIKQIILARKTKSLKGYKVINGKGKFIIPGLIDTHLHLGIYARSQNHLLKHAFKLLLANGITGVRDAGSNSGLKQMLAIRDSINERKLLAPKLYLSAMTANSWLKKFNAGTLTALVDTFSTWGVDGIKIKRVTFGQAKEIIDAAKPHHLPVYGHTYNAWENETKNVMGDFTSDAIDHGISGVMHSIGSIPTGKNKLPPTPEPAFTDTTKLWVAWWLYFDNLWLHVDEEAEKEYIKKMIKYNVWLEPTLSVESIPCSYPSFLKSKDLQYLLTEENPNSIYGGAWFPAPKGAAHDSVCMAVKRMQVFAKRFYDAGGFLLAGTDGMLYGADLRDELKNFTDAGIPAIAVLKIATYNNALALGWIKNYGTIEKGKIANLVLLQKNPLDNIQNLELIEAVILNGKLYNRKILNKWKEDAAKATVELKNKK
jgi:hypothetical protein